MGSRSTPYYPVERPLTAPYLSTSVPHCARETSVYFAFLKARSIFRIALRDFSVIGLM